VFAERTVQYLTFNDVVGCGSAAVTFLTSGGSNGWPSRHSSSAMCLTFQRILSQFRFASSLQQPGSASHGMYGVNFTRMQ
jgi:hypothetical protein